MRYILQYIYLKVVLKLQKNLFKKQNIQKNDLDNFVPNT